MLAALMNGLVSLGALAALLLTRHCTRWSLWPSCCRSRWPCACWYTGC
jgi:hypothetical protein